MNIYYENHTGQIIHLSEWPAMIQNPEDLISYEWKYDTKNYKITGFKKEITEKNIEVSIFADSKDEFTDIINKIFEIAEIDVLQEKPGKLYFNEQYLKCYIFKDGLSEFDPDMEATDITLSIVSDAPKWINERKFEFRSIKKVESWLDHEYNHNYDYMADRINRNINNESFADSEFQLIVYGPCINPVIYINEHEYSIECSLEEGDYIIIDSLEKTIMKTSNDGTIENVFDLRNRDSYIFQKIPNGIIQVLSEMEFGFDLIILEERSKPLWT